MRSFEHQSELIKTSSKSLENIEKELKKISFNSHMASALILDLLDLA